MGRLRQCFNIQAPIQLVSSASTISRVATPAARRALSPGATGRLVVIAAPRAGQRYLPARAVDATNAMVVERETTETYHKDLLLLSFSN